MVMWTFILIILQTLLVLGLVIQLIQVRSSLSSNSVLSLKRYAEEVAWHEGEGVYADGTETAKSSEFFVDFCKAGTMDPDRLDEAAQRYRIDASALDRWIGRQPDWKLEYEDDQVHVYRRR